MDILDFKQRIRFDNDDGLPVVEWFQTFDLIPDSTSQKSSQESSQESRLKRLDAFRFRNVMFLINQLQDDKISKVKFVQDVCRHAAKIDGIPRLSAVTDRVVKVALDTTTYSRHYFSSKVWVFELNASEPNKWTMGTDFDFENPCLLRPHELKRRLLNNERDDDIEDDFESERMFHKHRNRINNFHRKPPIYRGYRRLDNDHNK